MNLCIEVNTFLILSVIGAFIYEDLPTSLYDTVEWTLVVLIYMIVMVPTLVNIVLLIHNIIMKIRRPNRGKMTIDISANQGKDIEANNKNI
jgi:hypothetical protein